MYIGNDLQIAHPSYKIIDDISSGFNGSTTSFALQVSGATPVPFPISTQQVMISVNGVVQEPDPNGNAGFKLLGSNIVFSSAPANGHAFFGVINAGADYVTAGSEFPDGSATAPSFTFQDDQDTGWFRSGSGAVGYSANGAQTLTFDGNGLTVTGDASFVGDSSKNLLWDKSDGQLEFVDNATAVFGTGSDLKIYHNGTRTIFDAATSKNIDFYYNGTQQFWFGNNEFKGKDNNKIILGDHDDLQIFHDGSHSRINVADGGAGRLIISGKDGSAGDPGLQLNAEDSKESIICDVDAGVRIFHNGNLKFETHSGGINVTGSVNPTGNVALVDDSKLKLGTGDDLQIYHDSSNNHSFIKEGGAGNLYIFSANLRIENPDGSKSYIEADDGGAASLFHDGNLRFYTRSNGCTVDGTSTQSSLDFRTANAYRGSIYAENNNDIGFLTASAAWRFKVANSGDVTAYGTVSDPKGNLRSIPLQDESGGAYTLVASDAGQAVHCHSSTTAVTVNQSVFAAGDAVTIVNGGTSDLTITQGSSFTLRNSADASTGNRTLAQFGMATIWFSGHNVGFISGAGLS